MWRAVRIARGRRALDDPASPLPRSHARRLVISTALCTDGAMQNVKIPAGGGAGRLAQVLVLGGAAVYGVTHSLFNVEGGHRCVWASIG